MHERLEGDHTAPDRLETGDYDWKNICQQFCASDPTASKDYSVWIVESYLDSGIKLWEDLLSRVKPALTDYGLLFRKKILSSSTTEGYGDRPIKEPINETNIYSFCGLVGCGPRDRIYLRDSKRKHLSLGLEDLTEKYAEQLKALAPKIMIKTEEDKAIKEFEGSTVTVIRPLTKEAGIKYGSETRWCTAARENNQFENYNKAGPLYILIPKAPRYPREKYQLNPATDSYMDDKDSPVTIFFIRTISRTF